MLLFEDRYADYFGAGMNKIEEKLLNIANFFEKNERHFIGMFCDVGDVTDIPGRIRVFLTALNNFDKTRDRKHKIKDKILDEKFANSSLWKNGVLDVLRAAKLENRAIDTNDAMTMARNISVLIDNVSKFKGLQK